MNSPTLRMLSLLLALCLMAAAPAPVYAGRLASLSGEAGDVEVRDEADFKLGDQSAVTVNYKAGKAADGCAVRISVYREQNGRWLHVNTVLRTNGNSNGSKDLTLPAGSYRIQVIAKQAKFDVNVDI